MNRFSRRNFLKIAGEGLLAASGILGLGALIRFLGYQAEPPAQCEYTLDCSKFDLGPASQYPPDSRTNIPDVPAVLVHSASGFTALSLVCTHLGCTLEQKPDGFGCPCHGSHFDPEGQVLRGPATKRLASLRVEQDQQGHLILNKNDRGDQAK
jgi:cytochrome b6-f complex iron-sulfur subunit